MPRHLARRQPEPGRRSHVCSVVSSGFPELDAGLPGGGWPAGALTEILPAHEGIGELRLLGPALAGLSVADCGSPGSRRLTCPTLRRSPRRAST